MPDDTTPVPVPVPFWLELRGGVHSLVYNGRSVQTRIHNDDVALIDQEARALGVTRSHFIRWATLQLAVGLHERRTGMRRKVTL